MPHVIEIVTITLIAFRQKTTPIIDNNINNCCHYETFLCRTSRVPYKQLEDRNNLMNEISNESNTNATP